MRVDQHVRSQHRHCERHLPNKKAHWWTNVLKRVFTSRACIFIIDRKFIKNKRLFSKFRKYYNSQNFNASYFSPNKKRIYIFSVIVRHFEVRAGIGYARLANYMLILQSDKIRQIWIGCLGQKGRVVHGILVKELRSAFQRHTTCSMKVSRLNVAGCYIDLTLPVVFIRRYFEGKS